MSSRASLIAQLKDHRPYNSIEAEMLVRVLAFVEAHEDCFERSLAAGHVTGSAWIVNPERTHTLLVHHRRLDRWLQPGGHCDGSADVLAVAVREAEEETGIRPVPESQEIFDVDAHDIPARAHEPAHVHYDIRFLCEASNYREPVVSPESRAVAWVALDHVASMETDGSVLRLIAKTRAAGRHGTRER